MRRFVHSAILIALGAALVACGGGSSKKENTPVTSNAFVFIQEVPYQGAWFTPMLGQYVNTNGNIDFQTAVAIDNSTGQPLTADFGSLYLAGDKVAFDLYGGTGVIPVDQWDIYVARADGSSVMQITNDLYEDSYPQLSADGGRVVFTSRRDPGTGVTDMIVVRSAVNPYAPEQVLPLPLGASDIWDPTFSPDGTKIVAEAYGYNAVDGWFDGLVMMNTDGSNARLLTNPYSACECWDGFPTFTPDGSKIIFTGGTNTATESFVDIYSINADGSGTATQLTDGVGFNADPVVIHVPGMPTKIVFSSDRDRMTATASTGYELYQMNLDGSNVLRLTSNSVFDGFSQEWFSLQASASGLMGARLRHAHRLGTRPSSQPISGMRWR